MVRDHPASGLPRVRILSNGSRIEPAPRTRSCALPLTVSQFDA